MDTRDFVKDTQRLLNFLGATPPLFVDGAPGARTEAALASELTKHVRPGEPLPTGQIKPFWIAQLESRLGWTEFDHDAEIAKDWGLVGLPQYKTVIGTSHAWCGLACAVALNSGGLKHPRGAAGAANWTGWGEPSEYVCGAFLPLRHASGGRHICCFLYWHDKEKKLAACIGGNQSNKYSIAVYNLSGNANGHDEVVGGPRWPLGYPHTGFVYTKKGGVDESGSTR